MARTAGLLWIASVLLGIYAEVFVRGAIVVHGNAAATQAAIAAAEPAFRRGFVADLTGDMAYLAVTVLLYTLLQPVNRTAARLMACFGTVGCAVMAANLVNMLAPLVLLQGAPAGGLSTTLVPLVLSSLRLHAAGYSISIALFSIQVGALGWLILRAKQFPRVFGLLFVIEAVCNLTSSLGGFLALHWVERLGTWILLPGLPAEAGFSVWLAVFGSGWVRPVSTPPPP